MKTALLLLTMFVCNASAIQLKDLVGSWSGQRTETLSGTGTQYKITAEITSNSGGVVMASKGSSPIIGPYKARDVFSKDGKFSETITTSGFIVSSAKGSWKIKNGVIEITATGGNLSGKSHFSGVIQTFGKNQIKYKGTAGGSKVSFDVRRK